MAGPSDISAILSQAGRIEKVNQSPFAQSEVTKQILTEQEARERLRMSREVNAPKKADEIAVREHGEKKKHEQSRHSRGSEKKGEKDNKEEKKHIIDVVI